MKRKNRSSKVEDQQIFPKTGLVRLRQILAPVGPIPVSRSAFWAGVKVGIYPAPIKLSRRVTCWRAEEIQNLFDGKPDA